MCDNEQCNKKAGSGMFCILNVSWNCILQLKLLTDVVLYIV